MKKATSLDGTTDSKNKKFYIFHFGSFAKDEEGEKIINFFIVYMKNGNRNVPSTRIIENTIAHLCAQNVRKF